MNQIDPAFLERSRAAFTLNAPLSLKGIRDRVAEKDSGTARRDALSALDSVARLFERDLAVIRAAPRVVRDLFASKTAAQLGISDKRYANIRSCVTAAIRSHGQAPRPITQRIPLTADWQVLLDRIEKRTYRMALYRLATFCSFMNIPPAEVDPAALLGFLNALEAEEIVKNPRRILKYTIAHWNMCGRRVPGWPAVRLSSPFKRDIISLPLSAFPESFQQDLSRWTQRMLTPDLLDPGAPIRPLRAITVYSRVGLVVRFASALVHHGCMKVEEISGLSTLLKVERVKAGLRYFLGRSNGMPTPYVAAIANTLFLAAKHYCRIDAADLQELSRIRKRLEGDNVRQMTPRNRERLRQFDNPENVRNLLAFPQEERARGLSQKNTLRAAKCFERALAAALLIHCCLRISNLRTINLDTDISWAGGKCYLSIDGARVKNGQHLEFELPRDAAELLREYVRDHRPRLAGSNGLYLFPGRDGGPRPHNTMRTDFQDAMRRRAGLVMHPHLMRHAIAKIVVERDSSLYVPMSQHLGHKRIDMTMAHYLGTETRASARHINRLLRDAVASPEIPED